jgi:hypothetical protein
MPSLPSPAGEWRWTASSTDRECGTSQRSGAHALGTPSPEGTRLRLRPSHAPLVHVFAVMRDIREMG